MHWFRKFRKPKQSQITRTGETFEERKTWHDRGELSPGEHAMAREIREHLAKSGLATPTEETK